MWKVMAADDEAYIREALEKLISWEKLGCHLQYVAGDGKELMERMQEDFPDIVITDIKMPGADGLEVCRYVYENCPEAQVIILSAYSDFEYARTALRYGACEYVLKISVLEELPGAVEKAICNLEKQKKEFCQKAATLWLRKGDTDSLYNQMVRYIEENLEKKITLEDMAECLHANSSYLSRLYKNRSGINLFDDILRKRVEKAKGYMRTTDWKIYQISEAVGFEDTGYFSRVFKRYTKMSPKDFRNIQGAGHEK